jgi:hypothetical protein
MATANASGRLSVVFAAPACRPWRASPCSRDVRCHRGRGHRDPRRLRSGRGAFGRCGAAPAVPRRHRQRGGAGVRPNHCRLGTANRAAAPGHAVAFRQGTKERLILAGRIRQSRSDRQRLGRCIRRPLDHRKPSAYLHRRRARDAARKAERTARANATVPMRMAAPGEWPEGVRPVEPPTPAPAAATALDLDGSEGNSTVAKSGCYPCPAVSREAWYAASGDRGATWLQRRRGLAVPAPSQARGNDAS